jgi:hypothetical protein
VAPGGCDKLEANKTADIDTNARAIAIWNADAPSDLFCFFFMGAKERKDLPKPLRRRCVSTFFRLFLGQLQKDSWVEQRFS